MDKDRRPASKERLQKEGEELAELRSQEVHES